MLSSTLHIVAGTEIDFQVFAFLIGKIGKAAIEHGLSGRNQLDDRGISLRQRSVDSRQQARQLHREEELGKEALLGSLENRQRGRLGTAVERVAAVLIDDAGFLERLAQIGMDNRLSRGRDNVKERGSDVDSPNAGRCCCALF